jgi:hypothetical protein
VAIAESTVEEAALSWLGDLGHAVLYGPDIAPGEPAAERASYEEIDQASRKWLTPPQRTASLLLPHVVDELLASWDIPGRKSMPASL